MNAQPPTVIVVDDDPAIREALESLLRSVDMRVESFGSVQEFLDSPPPSRPCCIVLDVRMPGLSGLDLQDRLAKGDTHIPIVFITGHADVPMTVRAMKAGAVEFLEKPFRDQQLLDAIHLAIEDDRSRHLEDDELGDIRRRVEALTPRERQVLELVTMGLLNKMIAARIGLQEITVKVHRRSVMRKMGAGSVAELVKMTEKLHLSPKSV